MSRFFAYFALIVPSIYLYYFVCFACVYTSAIFARAKDISGYLIARAISVECLHNVLQCQLHTLVVTKILDVAFVCICVHSDTNSASRRSRVGVGMNRSVREGKKCKSALNGPTDWILRYIQTTFTFLPLFHRALS